MTDTTFDFIQGPNYISVDLLERNLSVTGSGPILTCLSLQTTRRLDAAGDFTATFPHNDPAVYHGMIVKTRLLRFYVDGEHHFTGIIERMTINLANTGERILTVTGRDLTGELAEAPVGFLELSDGSGGPVNDGPADILAAANTFTGSGWQLVTTGEGFATTLGDVYAKFAGESALKALIMVGEHIGEHWRVSEDGTQKIVWMRNVQETSTILAVGGSGEPVQIEGNPRVCVIQRFAETVDGYGLAKRIYPFGGGQGDVRLTLVATDRAAPAGYTLSIANNYIEANTGPGTEIGIYREFKGIRPISNTDADQQAAANALFDAALEYLKRRDSASDGTSYTLDVAALSSLAQVGRTLEVVYEDDIYTVDAEFVILEIRDTINPAGMRLSQLTVAPVARKLKSDNAAIVGDMEAGKVFSAHPQLNANAYTTSYRVFVGYDQTEHLAEIPFWFGDEVTEIQQVLFRFQLKPVVDTSTQFASVSSGASSASTTAGGSSHSHTVNMSNHTHSIPDHDHRIGLGQGSGGRNVGIFAGGVLYYEGTDLGVLTHDTESDSGATTSGNGGGAAETSNSESAHTHNMPHTHVVTPDTEFGLFKETDVNTYAINGLEYQINGGGWIAANTATDLGGDRYLIDITDDVSTATFRPVQEDNLIEIRHNGREIDTIDGDGTTVTVDCTTNHGLATGQKVTITGTTNYNGTYTVTVIDPNTFTFLDSATPTETTGMVFTHKTVMIDAFLSIRQIIQTIHYT